jgi:hypothetical protein
MKVQHSTLISEQRLAFETFMSSTLWRTFTGRVWTVHEDDEAHITFKDQEERVLVTYMTKGEISLDVWTAYVDDNNDVLGDYDPIHSLRTGSMSAATMVEVLMDWLIRKAKY